MTDLEKTYKEKANIYMMQARIEASKGNERYRNIFLALAKRYDNAAMRQRIKNTKRLYTIVDKYGFTDIAHMNYKEVHDAIADGFEVRPFDE